MQCKLFFPCFKDSSSWLPHFMLAFPCPFSSFVRGQCADHEMWQAWTNLATTQSIDLLWQTSKFYTSKFQVQNFHFPNVSKTRRLHLCHIPCVCPFGQYGDYEMWQASSNLLVNASSNLLQVACLFSPHFPLMLFRHLNYLSGKKLAGRQENLTNLANMHWVFFTSLGRDNKGCVTHCVALPFTLKRES
jgi:hypothetical protein